MGDKGAKLTGDATAAAEMLVDVLQPLGDVASKKMFGGYGIFGDGVMFALVDSGGTAFLRVDDGTLARYQAADSEKHGRMPYQSIPPAVLADEARLVEWADEALAVARAHKK